MRTIKRKTRPGGSRSAHGTAYETGMRLLREGRPPEAAACFEQALRGPGATLACYLALAQALAQAERYSEMVRHCEAGLARFGGSAELWNALGLALYHLDRKHEAAVAFGRVASLDPESFRPYYLMARALASCGESRRAATCFELALRKNRDQGEVWSDYGQLLHEQGDWQGALRCLLRALELMPNAAPTLVTLGGTLLRMGQYRAAEPFLERALATGECRREALINLASVRIEGKRHRDAVNLLRELLTLDPDSIDGLNLLARAQLAMCSWDGLDEFFARMLRIAEDRGLRMDPFVVLRSPATPRQQLLCARLGAASMTAANVRPFPVRPTGNSSARLRVGYLSCDLQRHATAELMAGMFESHDREQFEISAYSYGPDDGSPMRRRLVEAFEHFFDIRNESLEETAQRIYRDGIDILVDLKGYTQNSRMGILAWRPAPVQVGYLGYPGALGAAWVDYAIADRYVIPPAAAEEFDEKIAYLPDCYQVNDRRRSIPEAPFRSALGLPEKGIALAAFNASYKISPELFTIWMKVLRQTPDAFLWLIEDDPETMENLRREAAARGIAAERLIFAPRVSAYDHLARLRVADLLLDTFPVNGHTTTSEALWMGCPVLTCSGETFASRVAGSLLRAVGMPGLVAPDLAGYEAKALALAARPETLMAIRRSLEARRLRCALFDTGRTTRQIERAYRTMWQIYAEGRNPRSFSVAEQ